MNSNSYGQGYYSGQELNKSLTHCFLWMTIGLLTTGAVSAFLYSSNLFISLLQVPMIPLLLALAQIMIVVSMSAGLYRFSSSTMKVLFIVYAFTLGISLTSIFYVYDLGTIYLAFGVSAFYFLCLAIIGMTTKKNMRKLGTICYGALFALIISSLFMMLFRIPMSMILYSILGLLIFTGITIWDIQRMPQVLQAAGGQLSEDKLSIYLALDLYLDFINIFLYILRLMGSRNSRN